MLPEWLSPNLAPTTVDFIRCTYGVLLLAHLSLTLPHARRFFLGERWGGYGESSWPVHLVQNPCVLPFVLILWFACAFGLVTGHACLWAALGNLLLCRYFHLRMRWRGILRGMGAPGFIACWLATAVFLLELATAWFPSCLSLVVFVLQLDFALIMLTAGVAKVTSGYAAGNGMEYGMANPQWGYWAAWYRQLPPAHWFFRFNNLMAWSGEIGAGLLMLWPATRFWGALFIQLSFVYIAANIRLLLLPAMVMLCAVVFFTTGTPGETLLAPFLSLVPPSRHLVLAMPAGAATVVAGLVSLYAILLPLGYAGMLYNFHARKALPGRLQAVLDGFANFSGLILWRVFSADHTNFFIHIHRQCRRTGRRTLVSRWGLAGGLRYSHVAEAITVTCLFTTLKYYPSKWEFFRDKLLRYARTLPCAGEEVLVFEYFSVRKTEQRFDYVPVSEYLVDPVAGRVEEYTLDEHFSVRCVLPTSPVHETARMGTYAPSGDRRCAG